MQPFGSSIKLQLKLLERKKICFRDTVERLARANHNFLVKDSVVIGFKPAEAAQWTRWGLETNTPWLVDERQKSFNPLM